jgi:RsiW-degrading membrane proteinase PrsW (M82 family)
MEDSLYFWRIDRLKDELRLRDLPAREVLAYVTAHVVLWTSAWFVPAEETVVTGPDVALDVALMVMSVIIPVVGLWAAYRANGGAEGRDFAGRLLAVGWVLGLRLLVLWAACFALVFILGVAAAAAKREIADPVITSLAWGVTFAASVVFFWRLAYHLRSVRRAV